MPVPSTCPECGAIDVTVRDVPPDMHDRGDSWTTRAECEACDEYVEWFG
jgi:hypothetical protein